MRVVIDANVLFPTVLREIVLGVADLGGFEPHWSNRILEEWRRAAARLGTHDGQIAEMEISAITARFQNALIEYSDDTEARLYLPDPDDVHVLAAAVDIGAGEILTLNSKDFPTNALAAEGVIRRHPDEFLVEQFHATPKLVSEVVEAVLAIAGSHGIDVSNPRGLLKRAKLPRLGKALYPL